MASKPDTIDWANAALPADVIYPAAAVEASGYEDGDELPHEEFNGIVALLGLWTLFLDDAFGVDSTKLTLGSGNEFITPVANGFAVQAGLGGSELFRALNLDATNLRANGSASPTLKFGESGEAVMTGQLISATEYRVTLSHSSGSSGVYEQRGGRVAPYELLLYGEQAKLDSERMLVATNRSRETGLYITEADGSGLTNALWEFSPLPGFGSQNIEVIADFFSPRHAVKFGTVGQLAIGTDDGTNVELVFSSSNGGTAQITSGSLKAESFLNIEDGQAAGGGKVVSMFLPQDAIVYQSGTSDYAKTEVEAVGLKVSVLEADVMQVTEEGPPTGISRIEAVTAGNIVRASALIEITIANAASGVQSSDCTILQGYNAASVAVSSSKIELTFEEGVGTVDRPTAVTIGGPTSAPVGIMSGPVTWAGVTGVSVQPLIWSGSAWVDFVSATAPPLATAQTYYLSITVF